MLFYSNLTLKTIQWKCEPVSIRWDRTREKMSFQRYNCRKLGKTVEMSWSCWKPGSWMHYSNVMSRCWHVNYCKDSLAVNYFYQVGQRDRREPAELLIPEICLNSDNYILSLVPPLLQIKFTLTTLICAEWVFTSLWTRRKINKPKVSHPQTANNKSDIFTITAVLNFGLNETHP